MPNFPSPRAISLGVALIVWASLGSTQEAGDEAPPPAPDAVAPDAVAPDDAAPAGPGDAAAGEFLYAQICAVCHGPAGDGGTGPSLRGIAERHDAETLATFIMYPTEKMPAFYPTALTEKDVEDIAAFVIGL